MVPRACRPFTILDGMVLVAATAVGLALCQAYVPSLRRPYLGRPEVRLVPGVIGTASCMVVPWMLGLLVLRLRRPRAALRRLSRQPGFVACAAAAAALLPALCWIISVRTFRWRGWVRLPMAEKWNGLTDFVGPGILGAWLALALSRRWRSEPGWIDGLGRLLGAFSIVAFLVAELLRVVQQLLSLFFDL